MIFAVRVLVALFLLTSAAQAAYAVPDDAVSVDPSTPHEFLVNPPDKPQWLESALETLKSEKKPWWEIQQSVLLSDGQRPSFLALIWYDSDNPMRYFELYRLDGQGPGPPRLQLVEKFMEYLLDIIEPTGRRTHGDSTAVFLQYGSGGSGLDGYGIKVYRLDATVTDVTPGRVVAALPAPRGSRVWDLVVSDDRWAHYFLSCGGCGPVVAFVLTWRSSQYEPACRDHPEFYARYEKAMRGLIDEERNFPLRRSESTIDLALILAQTGRGAEARKVVDDLVAERRRNRRNKTWQAVPDPAHFQPVIAAATASSKLACPVLGYRGEGAHPDWKARVNSFR
jgi:hypothetical protein